MQRDAAIAILKTYASKLRAKGARALYLFGSTVRNEARPDSDLDLFIEYDADFSIIELVALKRFLQEELKTEIHITTRDSLHPMLKRGIEAEAVRIY